ncbi:MAG TPA: fatty acid desaturase [Candidatus Binatia bacterium]|nr:fatty acid desaturase [Candidatus Binatia bacterium]
MTTAAVGMGAAQRVDGSVEHSPAALRRRYATAFKPIPWIYWTDMLASAALGWSAFLLAHWASRFSVQWFILEAIATCALYRAVLFIHELTHLRRKAVPGFNVVWDLVLGIPLMVPSLMYIGSHGEHHRRMVFGTDDDPEYAPIASWSTGRILFSSLPILTVPGLLVVRYAILGPLSYVIRPLRPLVVGYMSTLVINPAYKRKMPEGRNRTRWYLEEAGTALVAWSITFAMVQDWMSTSWLWEWYFIASLILLMNHVRTLVAHRYHNDGQPMDLMGQYLDSVNLDSDSWFTILLAPVGLRYHALHHLLPTVPYHSLGRIHREMLSELPKSTPYRQAEHRTHQAAMRRLFAKQDPQISAAA